MYNSQQDVPLRTEQLAWDQMEKTIPFESSLPWGSKFSLQTFWGKHKSNETKLMELFSDTIKLSPPKLVTVRNVVINDTLAAVIEWETIEEYVYHHVDQRYHQGLLHQHSSPPEHGNLHP